MADIQKAQQEAATPSTGKTFAEMEVGEKISWLGKVVVMLVTGGFAFPNIFVE